MFFFRHQCKAIVLDQGQLQFGAPGSQMIFDKICYDSYADMIESRSDHNIISWVVLKQNSQTCLFSISANSKVSGALSLVLSSSIIVMRQNFLMTQLVWDS